MPFFSGVSPETQTAPMLDGVFLWKDSMPGSNIPGQNLGMTLVHEVGALFVSPHQRMSLLLISCNTF